MNPFADLPKHHFGVILADPPWSFATWSKTRQTRAAENHYSVMSVDDIAALPVGELAADDCVLFLWCCWPSIKDAFNVIDAWNFSYKTCGFAWLKADNRQPDFFHDELPAQVGLGYWTRSNSEPCLLATRGAPKRLNADVRQAIIAPRREHSRKPDRIRTDIERLVDGPYLEVFAREQRAGWTCCGNEVDKFSARPDSNPARLERVP